MTTFRVYFINVVLVHVFLLTSMCIRTMATPMVPSNVAVVVGSKITLHCAAGATVFIPNWLFVKSGASMATTITDGRTCHLSGSDPSNSPYQLNGTDTDNGQCDLIINNVTPDLAGWYQCDMSLFVTPPRYHSYAAQVTVLYSTPNCSVNVTNDVAAVDDYVSMRCEVSYSYEGVNATMNWTNCQYQTESTDTSKAGTIMTTVSEISVMAQKPYLQTCRCNTVTESLLPTPPAAVTGTDKNISSVVESYSYAWRSDGGIQVQYCPDNVTLSPPTNSVLPPKSHVITCHANGNPSPIFYELAYEGELVENQTTVRDSANSSSLTLSYEGLYNVTCKATNHIISAQQNRLCSNRSMVYVYNISSSAPLLTTVGETTEPPRTTNDISNSIGGTTNTARSTSTPSPTSTPGTTPNSSNETVIQTKESECTDPCCPITCILPICVVCGTAVLVGAGVATYLFWRHKNPQETTPKLSLTETPNGTENEIAGYEMSPTATQSQPDVTRHSRGGYPPSQQEPPVRSPEILPVDPAGVGVGVVYAELQPQPQVNNRPGSRQPLQFQTDNSGEYSHVKYA